MAIILCPECGSEISDKATACPKCGCPSSEWAKSAAPEETPEVSDEEKGKYWCRHCFRQNKIGASFCQYCGNQLNVTYERANLTYLNSNGLSEDKPDPEPEKPFNGIYRYSWGKQIPIYCPRCKSEKCHWIVETTQHDAVVKTKTRYTVNLNPLHPFTLANKKEKKKVVTPAMTIETKMVMCDNCGHTFL